MAVSSVYLFWHQQAIDLSNVLKMPSLDEGGECIPVHTMDAACNESSFIIENLQYNSQSATLL